ncbi:MAG: hypothetical protein IKE52_05515 [Mogibacterium sp.]|nr:hypothetical protein [Mogibacterium sp.]
MSWEASDDAGAYKVYRSTDGESFKYVGTATGNEYEDSKLRTGTTYYYLVSARKGLRQSDIEKKKAVKITPELEMPELKADISKGVVELEYTKVDGAIAYEIIRDGENIGQVETTTFTDDKAEPNTPHNYEVKAIRYAKQPVYSKSSEKVKVKLRSAPALEIKIRDDDLRFDWDESKHYDNFKFFNGSELLMESDDTEYTLDEFELDKVYDIRLVAYSSENDYQSPPMTKRFKVIEEDMTTEAAIEAACEWGVDIANDDSFSYGTGSTAHRCGCYFCGTNIKRKGKRYEKTYCCNPFVHACYAHGAGDPQMLKTCQRGGAAGMNSSDYTRYGTWKNVGKPSISNLQRGDVLVRPDHVMLYLGDGDIVHAAAETWGPDGIKVGRAQPFYGKVQFVVRYTGTGRGTMYSIKDVDENGNIIEDEAAESDDTDKEESE